MRYSRSVSDGWVLPEGGAEGGDLLGHLLHLGAALARAVRVVHVRDGIGAVQGEHLRQQQAEILDQKRKIREKQEIKTNDSHKHEKQLKKEVIEMRRELEDAFGLQKITGFENELKDVTK